LKIAQSEFKLTGAGITGFGKTMDGMKAKSKQLEQSIHLQGQKVQSLKDRYEQLKATKGADDAATQRALIAYNNAQASMQRMEAELQRTNNQIRLQSSEWYQLGERLTTTGKNMQEFGNKMKSIGKDLSMKITAPIVGLGVSALKMAIDYETAFTNVKKYMSGTEEEFAKMSDSIRQLAKDTPLTTNEIANVAAMAAQLGIQKENVIAFSKTMLDLSVSTNLTSDAAASSLAKFANITKMPQTEFQRLGSTITALGNNFAAMESDIVEMGMRLAGAGATIGMTDAQIMGMSASLVALGINAEAGGSAFSKLMVNIGSEVAAGGKKLAKFAKVAGMSTNEFKKAFKEDAAGAITHFLEGLGKVKDSGKNVFGVIDDLGLSEVRLRDALLRASGAGDLFGRSISVATKAWKENTELAKTSNAFYNTTANKMKMMVNKLKDIGITLGNILIPVTMKFLNKLQPWIDKFSKLSTSSQKVILATAGIAAAIGPLLVVSGTLISSTGVIIGAFGTVSSAIAVATTGVAAATPAVGALAGAFTFLTGPIGLTIAGIGLATVAVVGITKAMKEKKKVSFDAVEAQQKEIKSNEDLIQKYDQLRVKNQLSNDEMLRFLDIQSEIKRTVDPDKIKSLKDEQAKLLDKSTLTNKEMDNFLKYNQQIIDKAPNTEKAISDQGNAFASNTYELQKVNAEKLKSMKIDAEMQMNNAIGNENKLLAEQKKLQEEINQKEQERKAAHQEVNEISVKIATKEKEIAELKKDTSRHGQEILENANLVLESYNKQKQRLETKRDLALAVMVADQENLDTTNKEIKKLDDQKFKYESIILATVGLNAEKGKGLATIQLEIGKLEHQKSQLKDLLKSGQINTAEYQEQVKAIDAQVGKLGEAQTQLKNVNEIAGKTVYKDIIVDGNGEAMKVAKEINELLGRKIDKRVVIHQSGAGGVKVGMYAACSRYKQGGIMLVGASE
jgi:TP901 family phage tail tape measure protein